MSARPKIELQIKVELPEDDVVEDDGYEVKYLITNVGKIDFPPGGIFECHLKYPLWDNSYSVVHRWRGIPGIPRGKTLERKPYKIKAVAGPNAFVFIRIIPKGLNYGIKVVNEKNDKIGNGAFIGYLNVKTKEEKNSERNLQISATALRFTVYSLIVLIFFQGFDWVFQMGINDRWCIQNLVLSGSLLAGGLALVLLFVSTKYK